MQEFRPEPAEVPSAAPVRDDEIQAILSRALQLQGNSEDATAEATLQRTAQELGISPAALQQARTEVLRERQRAALEQTFRAKRILSFQGELVTYVSVNALLFAINWFTQGRLTWSLFVVFFWGLAVAMKGVAAFVKTHPDYQEAWRKAQERAGFPEERPV